jgi:hypothetical protein
MRLFSSTGRCVGAVVLVTIAGWASQAHAQALVGSWLRTDLPGKGIRLTVTTCCNGGLRLVYNIPAAQGQPAATMSIDSPMDGTEAPTLVGGKPSGQTMAIKRVDDRHYTAVVKVEGKPFGTSNGTVSADGKTITVEGVYGAGGQSQKVTETWVRQ